MDFYDYCNRDLSTKLTENEETEITLEPYKYIIEPPQGLFRERMMKAVNYWMKLPEDQLDAVIELVKACHNMSLLFDDIQDNSILRRGIPAAHCVYGVKACMNSVHYVFALMLEKSAKFGQDCLMSTVESLYTALTGQIMEIYWRSNFICPNEEEYKDMAAKKVSGILMWAAGLVQKLSGSDLDTSKLMSDIGVFFQIRDDYDNLYSEKLAEKKGFCDDLTEGKFGFPVMNAVTSHPEDDEILRILKLRTRDVELKKRCLDLLEKYGAKEYTQRVLEDMGRKIIEDVQKLGKNPLMEAMIDDLMKYKDGKYIVEVPWI